MNPHERITRISDNEYDYQCDLCDIHKKDDPLPFLSWSCWHDDDYIKTIVCLKCLKRITHMMIISEKDERWGER